MPKHNEMIHRTHAIRMSHVDEEARTVTFTGSSEYEAQRGGYIEVLSHDTGAIRTGRLDDVASILLNHDPKTIAGAIESWEIKEKQIEIVCKFTSTQRGTDAMTEVKEGALKGISVGYVVHKWEIDEETNTYRATDWEPYEFSFTPIPVDPSVGVGREINCEAFLQSINRSITEDKKLSDKEQTSKVEQVEARETPITPPAVDIAAIQAEAQKAAREDASHIARQAESVNLEAGAYLGMSRADASDAILAEVAKRGAEKHVADVADVTMGESADDKRRDHFVDLLDSRGSVDVLLELARANGDAIYSRQDIAKSILAPVSTRALETVSSLGNVTILAADKSMVRGFDLYTPWCEQVSSVRNVSDFKTVHSAGVTFGAFNTPGEGNAFTDLAMDDMGDTGSVAYKGGILQLTREAIYNDELGLFFQKLQNLGYQGRREEDIICGSVLEAATFTAATQALAFSAAGLKTAWAAFKAVTDGNSQRIGLNPKKILLPTPLVIAGLETTTLASGETTNRVFADGALSMTVVDGETLVDQNDWYLFADNNLANGLTLLKHQDYATPQVEEIDAGSVAARKFMVTYPLGAMINNLKTNAPIGIYKCTVV